ncbi:TspO/MBR family protein [Haloprofundus salilacus]|uniref:TspO/MBR family protein n=1 Tax=Haloprofundus salilacus TaxID=2876190 RepID=UPI001CCCFFC9|nr:TspO/MBR family protein [Haloprofundus salilacus]
MESTQIRTLPDGRSLATALGFVVLVNVVGAAPALFAGPDTAWFASLEKPWFYPPSVTFAVVWTALFTLQGIALWLLWERRRSSNVRAAYAAFAGQFVLNLAWTPAFFTLQMPLVALGVIVALWVALAVTVALFARVDRRAAALLVPYLLWASFAAVLNFEIWRLNASFVAVG